MVKCMIYYHSNESRKKIIRDLSVLVGWPVESEAYVYTLQHDDCYFGIQVNEEAAREGDTLNRGDYRSFPYFIDISCETMVQADVITIVKNVLEYLWKSQIAAVAECGFEEQLPFSGGIEKEDMHWPVTGIAINYEES